MLMSSGNNFTTPANVSGFGRSLQAPSVDGPYAHVSQEIQMWVNNYAMTMDVIKQQETKHLIQRAYNIADVLHHLLKIVLCLKKLNDFLMDCRY